MGTCNFLLPAPAVVSLCAEVRGSILTGVSNVFDCQPRLSRKSEAMEVKAMYGITGEHYAIDDEVLPTLDLHPAVEVRIDIEETGIKLFIGPREYEWPRGCPDVRSVRTGFCIPLDGPQREDM
jgi:hypothetical protein